MATMQRNTVVRTKLVHLCLEASTGSDTQIDVRMPESGPFLARYSPGQLAELEHAITLAAAEWFQNNPVIHWRRHRRPLPIPCHRAC